MTPRDMEQPFEAASVPRRRPLKANPSQELGDPNEGFGEQTFGDLTWLEESSDDEGEMDEGTMAMWGNETFSTLADDESLEAICSDSFSVLGGRQNDLRNNSDGIALEILRLPSLRNLPVERTRRVSFSDKNEVRCIEKSDPEDHQHLYYSCHELQKMMDELKTEDRSPPARDALRA